MVFFFSLGSALFFGTSDFIGGLLSRRADPMQVVAAAQATALVLMAPAFIVFGNEPTWNGLLWGAASGLTTAIALVSLFRALSASMPIGASVTGVVATGLPVIVGLASGERPESIAVIGLVAGLIALPLIVHDPERVEAEIRRMRPSASSGIATLRRLGVHHALIAGIGLGASSILFAQTMDADGMWPVLSSHFSSLALVVLMLVTLGRPVSPPAGARLQSVAVGAIQLGGVVFLLLALQRGLLSLVSVVQGLYPAVTIMAARLVLSESLQRRQIIGLVLAGAGVTLIGLSQ